MRGKTIDSAKCIFYVYAWYFKDTNEIFHIGKGKGNRYLDEVNHRNSYFKSILAKYRNNVDVKILVDKLTEQDALLKERELIKSYKEIGQCKTNLHEGGCGGNTGKYDDPERSRKLSEAASKRIGKKNSMFGKHHTVESKKKISIANKGKHLSEEHKEKLIAANTGRIKTKEELRKISIGNKGKTLSKNAYEKMMNKDCPYHYYIELDGQLIFDSISSKKLEEFCNNILHISRTITA